LISSFVAEISFRPDLSAAKNWTKISWKIGRKNVGDVPSLADRVIEQAT
jgi:hypothetical protein